VTEDAPRVIADRHDLPFVFETVADLLGVGDS
jgi:hypothetical protein